MTDRPEWTDVPDFITALGETTPMRRASHPRRSPR
jgi:hypothetical protein